MFIITERIKWEVHTKPEGSGWDTLIENKGIKENHLPLEYEIMGLELMSIDFTHLTTLQNAGEREKVENFRKLSDKHKGEWPLEQLESWKISEIVHLN